MTGLEPQVVERHLDALAAHGGRHRCHDCDYRRGQLIAAGIDWRAELTDFELTEPDEPAPEPDDDEDYDFTVDDSAR